MINLKRLLFIFILIIIFNHAFARDTIKSASEHDYPPFALVTDEQADGFSVELLRATLNAVEMDVSFYVGPWSEIKVDLTEGSIDVLPLVGRTPERETLYDFTVPYLTLYGAIFVKEGNAGIKTIEDLKGKRIVVMKGDNAEEFVRSEQLSKNITTTKTFEEAFQLVSEGKYDAVITNELVGKQLLKAANIDNVFLVSQINNFKQDFTFAVKEGDSELLTLLNDGLSRIIIDGTYEVIYNKWFGKRLVAEKPTFEKLSIDLRALQIRDQIEEYLRANPEKTLKQLQNDEVFRRIVVQRIGTTGHSALVESKDGIIVIHNDRNLEGVDVHNLKNTLPVFWEIISSTIDPVCEDSFGSYDWREEDGELREKYAYQACISLKSADGKSFFITAATFLDEYSGIGLEKTIFAEQSIQQKAENVAMQIEIYLSAYPDKTLEDLQNNEEFQKIAVQDVGETGYTAVIDYDKLITLFHPNSVRINSGFDTYKSKFPRLWQIILHAQYGNDAFGKYNYADPDGKIRDKFTYVASVKIKTADGVGLSVAATTYLDEYDDMKLVIEDKDIRSKTNFLSFLIIVVSILVILVILNKLNIIKIERNTIMFLLAFALILIIGLFIFNAFNITKNLEKSKIDVNFGHLFHIAEERSNFFAYFIEEEIEKIQMASTHQFLTNEELVMIRDINREFIEVFATNSKGIVTHSSEESIIGLDKSENSYFVNARDGIYVNSVYYSETAKRAIMSVSKPYNKGVIVARIDLEAFNEIFILYSGLEEAVEGLLAYRDENGDAVFFTDRRFDAIDKARDVIPKEELNIPITQAMLGNEQKFSDYVDYRGVPVFAVTKYIEELDVGLVVKVDQEAALKSVSKNIIQIWSSTFGIILAIIVSGIIFYFLFTNALRREIKNKTVELKQASNGLIEKVDQLQQSEKALIESEERSRTITQTAVDAIISINSKGIILSWNRSAERIFGYFAAEMINNDLKAILPAQYADNYLAVINWLKNDSKERILGKTIEITAIRKDGKEFPVELSLSGWEATGQKYFTGIIRDITERKIIAQKITEKSIELEDQLIKSEKQRLASISILSDLNETTKNLKLEIVDRKRAEEIHKTLFEVSSALNITEDLIELYGKIRKYLGNIVDTKNLFIALYDEETDMISPAFSADEKDVFDVKFPAGKTLTKYVIQTAKPLLASRQLQDELIEQDIIEIIGDRSEIWLGVPLKVEDRVIGVIAVQSYDNPNLYTQKDMEIFTFVSEEIARAIKHKQAEEQIKKDLKRITALLQEVYHRTKNNMAIISAILSMQSRRSDNEFVTTTFEEMINKIRSMSLVHEKLYKSKDLSNINLKEYIEDVTKLIIQSYDKFSGRITIKFDMQEMNIMIDTAIPLGLIINELITNIFKHAFNDGKDGEIFIKLQKATDGTINIELHDNGIGFPKKFDPRKDGSMGLTTVFSIVENQLKGEISVKSENGLKWQIKLPISLNKVRVSQN